MTSATFRLPGPLAISVANVDQMSGGRVELGIGAGWFEEEHTKYGIPFPSTSERFDRFEEQLAIITGLWETDGGFSHHGEHYQVEDSPGLPKPVQQPRPPVIIGGKGKKRTPALTAQYADEFNVPFDSPAFSAEQFERVRRACADAGREPVTLSNAVIIACGRDDAEVDRRLEAIGQTRETMDGPGVCGTPAQVVDRLGEYAEAGSTRAYLQVLDLTDLDHLELLAGEVMSQL
jgi:alkanesulfonate monooxygenase SsuD/methylene tetrahydromethanopterin reductase-like flavin-dependent oxidoreductase (luciferase family)